MDRTESFVAPSYRPIRILYAEDHEPTRTAVERLLGRDGHAVTAVADGREALARLEAGHADFDLLLSDFHMPFVSAIDVVKGARAMGFTRPIVVLSAAVTSNAATTLLALGVTEILEKPLAAGALRELVARWTTPRDT